MLGRSTGVWTGDTGLFYSHFSQVGQIGEDVHIDCRQLVVAQISEWTEKGRGKRERNLLKHFIEALIAVDKLYSLITFLSRADPFKHPKSVASLYLQHQQQLSTTHRTIYQSGSSVKRVVSTLMAHKSGPSTASFSGTSSSFQRASDWAWQSAGLLLSLLKCQRLMALWSIELLSTL